VVAKANCRAAGADERRRFECVGAVGACEAARAGVTCVADASDAAFDSMKALRAVGMRGVVFQESFGPIRVWQKRTLQSCSQKSLDCVNANSVGEMRSITTRTLHSLRSQLELIAQFALAEKLPLMMHARKRQWKYRC